MKWLKDNCLLTYQIITKAIALNKNNLKAYYSLGNVKYYLQEKKRSVLGLEQSRGIRI
jgi:hypothetical protein